MMSSRHRSLVGGHNKRYVNNVQHRVIVGLNLNNEVFGYYQGSDQFINQREYYKPSYTGGLRYNFAQGR